MRKRILITGISGFIGRHLARVLVKAGHEVFGIARTDMAMKDVTVYKVDILDTNAVEETCQNKDIIIHLSAITAHKDITENPYRSLWFNFLSTYNVLSSFVKSDACRFIYPSSGKVYGEPVYLPYDESHPINPQSVLGKSKRTIENLIDFFALGSEKVFVILRIFNVYGPNQRSSFVIPTILRQLEDETIVLGNITDKRDYLYIDDLIDAFRIVIDSPLPTLSVMNVGTGVSHSASGIVEELSQLIGRRLSVRIDASKFRGGEFPDERAGINGLKSLGWKPKYNLRAGLREILQAYTGAKV